MTIDQFLEFTKKKGFDVKDLPLAYLNSMTIDQFLEFTKKERIDAKDLPSELLDGLIPVYTPVFIGEDGESRSVRTERINVESRELADIIRAIKRLGWKYLFLITPAPTLLDPESILDPKSFAPNRSLYVRGCQGSEPSAWEIKPAPPKEKIDPIDRKIID